MVIVSHCFYPVIIMTTLHSTNWLTPPISGCSKSRRRTTRLYTGHPPNQSVHQLHNRPQVEAPAKQHPLKKTLLWQSAALALLEGPLMPIPTPIHKNYTDANEARCRHRRQDDFQLYLISTAKIVSTDGKAWCPVVEKNKTSPRHILGRGVGPKWGP